MPMELNPLVLSAALFIVILVLSLAGQSIFLSWRGERNLLRRTEKWSSGLSAAPGRNKQTSKASDFGVRALWTLLGLPGARKVDQQESIYAGTPLFYQRAGIYDANRLRAYQLLRYALLLLPFLGLVVFHLTTPHPYSTTSVLVALCLAIIGYLAPVYLLKLRARSRKKQLYRSFPDAIDLLMVCVQAGMGLDSAINRVAREIHVTSPELAKEFKILTLELKTGQSRNVCLKNMAVRTDLPDIDNLVNLLIQADKYGTGVSHAMMVHAEDMRHKRLARLEEKAAKLPVKLIVPLIFFIFPALFVVIIGPGIIQIFHSLIDK